MLTAEQVLATQKANAQTIFSLAETAFDGVDKLVDLNVQVAKTALTEAREAVATAFNVKDVQELLALQASFLQPSAEKAAAYSRHIYDIASATSADLVRAAEAQSAEAQKKFLSLVDNASKNAPAGSESAVALVRSTVAAANNAFESVQKAAKQAADVAEANFQAITTSAVKASSVPKAKRAA